MAGRIHASQHCGCYLTIVRCVRERRQSEVVIENDDVKHALRQLLGESTERRHKNERNLAVQGPLPVPGLLAQGVVGCLQRNHALEIIIQNQHGKGSERFFWLSYASHCHAVAAVSSSI